MYTLIERYINNLSLHDLNNLAINKNINLSNEELTFSYNFIKTNWKNILNNHGIFDIEKYKDKFTEENFNKIKQLLKESLQKYSKYI